GAEYPQALTSEENCGSISPPSPKIHNLDSGELEQLCSFLGHTITTHRNFYRFVKILKISNVCGLKSSVLEKENISRLPHELYRTAKLAKHLLKSQNETADVDNMMDQVLSSDDEYEDNANNNIQNKDNDRAKSYSPVSVHKKKNSVVSQELNEENEGASDAGPKSMTGTKFLDGRETVENKTHVRRPRTSINEANIHAIRELIEVDRHLTNCEMSFENYEKSDMLECIIQNNNNSEAACELYINRYPERRQPDKRIFPRLKENLINNGSFKKSRPTKYNIKDAEEVAVNVVAMAVENPSISSHQIEV
ncbi:hypothetical protein NQ317_016743, partial [Molorchus minor]